MWKLPILKKEKPKEIKEMMKESPKSGGQVILEYVTTLKAEGLSDAQIREKLIERKIPNEILSQLNLQPEEKMANDTEEDKDFDGEEEEEELDMDDESPEQDLAEDQDDGDAELEDEDAPKPKKKRTNSVKANVENPTNEQANQPSFEKTIVNAIEQLNARLANVEATLYRIRSA